MYESDTCMYESERENASHVISAKHISPIEDVPVCQTEDVARVFTLHYFDVLVFNVQI